MENDEGNNLSSPVTPSPTIFLLNETLSNFSSDVINCSLHTNFEIENDPRLLCACRTFRYSFGKSIFLILLLGLMTIGTAAGNFLVILAVALVKKLQTPSNLLIVSLACSDLFVSIMVMPLVTINQVRGCWAFNNSLCITFMTSDVLLCTSSILNLCAISIDRYLVITKPLVYAANRTPARMSIMIMIAWLGSAIISVPTIIVGQNQDPGICMIPNSIGYQVYATFGAFYIPLIIMLVLYGRIFKLARQMAQADAKQKLTTTYLSTNETAEELAAPPPSADHHSTLESRRLIRFKNPETGEEAVMQQSNSNWPNNGSAKKNSDQSSVASMAISSVSGGRLSATNSRSDKPGNGIGQGSSQRKKPPRNSESKAIVTLGVIMGCFTICWLPFFIIQLCLPFYNLMANPPKDAPPPVPPFVIEIFLWLGYVNSFLNPIIYAKFNLEFRTPFKEILLCRCRSINARLRSESYAEQYGLPMNTVKKRESLATINSSRRRSSDVYVNISRRGGRSRRNTGTNNEVSNGFSTRKRDLSDSTGGNSCTATPSILRNSNAAPFQSNFNNDVIL